MKQLQNNFTTQEQSEKLLVMGIPANTADLYYERHSEIKFERMNIRLNKIELADDFFEKHSLYTPHWSTGRLMEIYCTCRECTWEYITNNPPIEDILCDIELHVDELNFSKLN